MPVASDYQQVVKTCQPKEVPCLGQRACVECGRGTPSSVPCEGCPVLLISDAVDGKETGKAVSLWAVGLQNRLTTCIGVMMVWPRWVGLAVSH